MLMIWSAVLYAGCTWSRYFVSAWCCDGDSTCMEECMQTTQPQHDLARYQSSSR